MFMQTNLSQEAVDIAVLGNRVDNLSVDVGEIKRDVKEVNVKVDSLGIDITGIRMKLEGMRSFSMGMAAAISLIVSVAIPLMASVGKAIGAVLFVAPKV
jgi:predicted amino acid racemase